MDLALVKAIRQNSLQMAGQLQGMASAGSVKGARGILAQGMRNRKRGERLSGWALIWAVPFLGPFWQLLFSVNGNLWRSCFWDRLAVSVLEPPCSQLYVFLSLAGSSPAKRKPLFFNMNETSSRGLHFIRLQGSVLRIHARHPVGNAPLSAALSRRCPSSGNCPNPSVATVINHPKRLAGYSLRARGMFLAGNIVSVIKTRTRAPSLACRKQRRPRRAPTLHFSKGMSCHVD